jgi:FkbM family methyltransferase
LAADHRSQSAHLVARRLRARVVARAFERSLRRRTNAAPLFLGSQYGGWAIPQRVVDSSWICYTAGVGEDASFDVALAEMGCEVLAIDPTPRAVEYMKPLLAKHPRLALAPYAVWTRDTNIDFFPPSDSGHVSYSATNRQHTTDPIRVPARTISSMAREFGHERIDLLKLDIEGAEYQVIKSLELETLGVRVLCVEYHPDYGLRKMLAAVRSVLRRGYQIVTVNRTDVTFIRKDESDAA